MREQWSSKTGFVLAAAGSAVGLGNLWKFPYTVGMNGGGAYVALYLLFVLLIGMPLMLAAITFGRKTQLSVFGAYKSISRRWAFVGALAVICGFFILAFYSTVGGWVLYYLQAALRGQLNTIDPAHLEAVFSQLLASPIQLICYQFIFLLITLVIVLGGIRKGIEKASKLMMPALFLLLIIIAVRSLTLEGSMEGIRFLFTPDFSKITPDLAMYAMGQVFFSLSIGMGVMITYGSYLDKKVNLVQSAVMIPLLDTAVALIAALATIPAVFSFGFEAGEGPGMMFITLPAVFASMPFGQVFVILFFVLVLFAALTSSISMLEVAISYFVDEKKFQRKSSAILISIAIFIMGIPASLSLVAKNQLFSIGSLSIFDLYDKLTSNILLTTGAFLLSIFIGWVLKPENAIQEIEASGIHFRLAKVWSALIKYIVPVGVLIILIQSYQEFISALLR
ncbi:sodium-dependent transporter [Rubeoparvulum massiliense]|uniref:sodium-dependent transporter n=1 Tax=Rubeoparvulum massiliense TaxID=1631346 RepID=UPI00065E60F7|nr:sodium-dependent transporter [Rubeoparvulum massiliense]